MNTFELVMDNAEMQIHCNETGTPDPVGPPIVIEVPLTKGHIVRSSTASGYFGEGDVTLHDDSTTIDFYKYFGGPAGDTANYLYLLEFAGHSSSGLDWIPATPDGYELTDVRPYMMAYTIGSATDSGLTDADGWSPTPTKQPFLGQVSQHLAFDFAEFPTSWSATNPHIPCGAFYPSDVAWASIPGALPDPFFLVGSSGPGVHIIIQGMGYVFTFTPV